MPGASRGSLQHAGLGGRRDRPAKLEAVLSFLGVDQFDGDGVPVILNTPRGCKVALKHINGKITRENVTSEEVGEIEARISTGTT